MRLNENLESRLNQVAGELKEEISTIARSTGITVERAMTLTTILSEREAQDKKWGEQNHDDHYWFLIAAEEFGEIAKAMQENDPINFQVEVVQLSAVMFAWMECKYRGMLKSLETKKENENGS